MDSGIEILAVPGADAAPNVMMRDVVGNKADTALYTTAAAASLMRYLKAILSSRVLYRGIFTTGGVSMPADTVCGGLYGNTHFDGCTLMPITGLAAFEPRKIVSFAGGGAFGIFYMNNPFAGVPAIGDVYLILENTVEPVVGVDSAANVASFHVVGNKASTPIYAPTNTADIVRYLKGILNTLNMGARPEISLYESWQDEGGIDLTVWSTALGGTGTVARDVTEPPYLKVLLSGPVNADTARLYGDQRWFCGPDTYGTNTALRRLVMEFEAKLSVVASIDNPAFFMGLAAIQLADRTSDNLIGFILAADVLNSITDDGAGETTKAVGAPVLTNWHKYRMEILAGTVYFYIDEVLRATHTTAAVERLPDTAMFPVFYLPQEAGANSGLLHVGIVRIWTEDIAR